MPIENVPEAVAGELKKKIMLYQECVACGGSGCRCCKVVGVMATGVTEDQLEYIAKLDVLRQEAGISAAMLRDGRARELIESANRVTTIRQKIEQIVVTAGCDRGVVLLSRDGTTHYDAEVKCQVYDHENFSPLGDALIELYELTTVGNPKPATK